MDRGDGDGAVATADHSCFWSVGGARAGGGGMSDGDGARGGGGGARAPLAEDTVGVAGSKGLCPFFKECR